MNYNIEFIGAPGSGKTFIYKKIILFFNKKKIKINKPKEIFFKNYLKANTNIYYIRKLAYFFYFNKVKLKSNYLFKKEYKNLINFLNKEVKLDKNYKKIVSIYKKYLKTANYTKERKLRMLTNFQLDYFGCKYNADTKKNILLEEGFFQKIYLNYYHKKNKISKKLLIEYLSLVPKPKLIFYIKADFETISKRVKNRKDGFLYNYNKKFFLNQKKKF